MNRLQYAKQSITAGACKRCGKVLEYRPVTSIVRSLKTPCLTTGENAANEMQRAIATYTKYCSDCRTELKAMRSKRVFAIPAKLYARIADCFRK